MSTERARPRQAPRHARPVAPEEPVALTEEAVAVAALALLVMPLLVIVAGDILVFLLAGVALACALVVLVAAGVREDEDGAGGTALLPTAVTLAVMILSLVLALVSGERMWALPAIVVPAGCGWLALQHGGPARPGDDV